VAAKSDGYLPYFKFFPRDYLASPSVMQMTLEEQGCYIRMLSIQWVDGAITRRCLRGLLGMNDEQVEEMLKGPLGEVFEIQDGALINPRLQRERENACSLSRTRRDAGRMGARATAARRLSTPEDLAANAGASVKQFVDADAEVAARAEENKRQADAMAADMTRPDPVKRVVRNAKVELETAVGDWERHAGGPMPKRLKTAVCEYLLVRKEQRMKLWGKEMWTRNLGTKYTPDEWAAAYELAARSGWQSIHPERSKSKRQDRSNGFIDLMDKELGR
jgi:uncharacterized protein YdaU (DUF1376 family)